MKTLYRVLEGASELGGVTDNQMNESINKMQNKMFVIKG